MELGSGLVPALYKELEHQVKMAVTCQSAVRFTEESYTPNLEHTNKQKRLNGRVQLLKQSTV